MSPKNYVIPMVALAVAIAGVATGAASVSASINNTAGAVVGDTATAAHGARAGSIVQFAATKKV